MNDTGSTKEECCDWSAIGWVVGVLASFALVGGLAYYSVRREGTAGLEAQREAVRYQARREVEAASLAELAKYAVDPLKDNKAQLSVSRAMELLVAEWRDDSAAGRTKLLERLEASKKAPSFE